jgi:hypothetical protein
VYCHTAFIVGALDVVCDGCDGNSDVLVDLAPLKQLASQLMQYSMVAMHEDSASIDATVLPEGPATFSRLVQVSSRPHWYSFATHDALNDASMGERDRQVAPDQTPIHMSLPCH